MLLSIGEFHENWCSENHCLLYDVIHLCLYFPHLLHDLGELWCKVSEHNAVSICEFHENCTGKTVLFLWM